MNAQYRFLRLSALLLLSMISILAFSEEKYSVIGNYKLIEIKINGKNVDVKTKFQDLFIQIKSDMYCVIREDKNKDGLLTKDEIIIDNTQYKAVENRMSLSITSNSSFWNGEWNGGLNLMTNNIQLKKLDNDGNTFSIIFSRL
jgi:hypothetical protein